MEAISALKQVKLRMEAAQGRSPSRVPVELVAVSKFQTVEQILFLYHQGQRAFGENYVQELLEKHATLRSQAADLEFHFIGRLQTNKVKTLLPAVSVIHSVDSERLLLEIEKRAAELKKNIRVYFQVNIDEEPTKGGFSPGELSRAEDCVKRCAWVTPVGLMAIPDPEKNPSIAFSKMRALSQLHGTMLGTGLSMGMSSDFEEAIESGSTCVRVGTLLFGTRPRKAN